MAGGGIMDLCYGCGKSIRFWQKVGFNGLWHSACSKSWTKGYQCAQDFADGELRIINIKSPWELYWNRMKSQWRAG
jgi:hypothetical protein